MSYRACAIVVQYIGRLELLPVGGKDYSLLHININSMLGGRVDPRAFPGSKLTLPSHIYVH